MTPEKVLIVGMPRTRTTALLSMLESGGYFPVYEPYHPKDSVHAEYNPGIRRKREEEDKVGYLDSLVPENGMIAVKTLFPQQSTRDLVRLAEWADVILIPKRDLIEIICSAAVSIARGKWHGKDPSRRKVRVSRRVARRLSRAHRRAPGMIQRIRTVNGNVHELTFDQAVNGDHIRSLGIPCGKPKVVKCRDCSPLRMVRNLDQVRRWVQTGGR